MDKLIICIDRDNDLGIKAGEESPIIGRQENLNTAAKLGINDPEDSDVNTIYAGVKLYDRLKEDNLDIEIVSIAGDRDVGLISDQKIADQLDDIVKRYQVNNAILVSDGAEDESILPIIESRIKVDSVRRVVVRQSVNLESTYYILKTAFNDPKISHTFFVPIGLAALIYSFFIFAGDPKYAWAAVLGAIGAYMLYRGFGLDDMTEDFRFRMKQSMVSGKMSFITYSIALILALIGTILAAIRFWEYYTRTDISVGVVVLVMVFMNLSVWWYTAAGWIAMLGRMLDLHLEGRNYKQQWSYMFFIFSLGLLFWGASTFILSVSSSVDGYFISSSTGRNLLVIAIIGAIIVSLIGIWISTRTSDARTRPA